MNPEGLSKAKLIMNILFKNFTKRNEYNIHVRFTKLLL